MSRLEKLTMMVAMVVMADPANAAVLAVPAPVIGVGMGAAAVFGLGYRALKRRIAK
jgi:hypothetical protein